MCFIIVAGVLRGGFLKVHLQNSSQLNVAKEQPDKILLQASETFQIRRVLGHFSELNAVKYQPDK